MGNDKKAPGGAARISEGRRRHRRRVRRRTVRRARACPSRSRPRSSASGSPIGRGPAGQSPRIAARREGPRRSRGARRRGRQLRNQDRPAQRRAGRGAGVGRPGVQEATAGRRRPRRSRSSDIPAVRARTWWSSRIRRKSTTSWCARCARAIRGRSSASRPSGTSPHRIDPAPSSIRAGSCTSSASNCLRTSRSASGTAPRRSVISCCRSVRPEADHLSEDALAALVTRDSMIGVDEGVATTGWRSRVNGVHDMGGMQGMGPVRSREG